MPHQYTIAGIGELLWDTFPHRSRIGGAPGNFAWHCSQLGAKAYPISAIGADKPGERMRSELEKQGINTTYLMTHTSYPTGQAKVTFDTANKPNYEIVLNAAWDHIALTPELVQLAKSLDSVCFGSLSQRSLESRSTIQQFLTTMPAKSLKIFDINLRQSFYSKEIIERSLQVANVLKLSDEELAVLTDYFDLEGSVYEQLQQILNRFKLRLLVYTRGAQGSLLLGPDSSDDAPGIPGTELIDSVGAGDSFTAAISIGLLNGWPLSKINRFANKVAGFVCSQVGATPNLPQELIPKQ
jgi:fructokinase